jgi:hypothetical protein
MRSLALLEKKDLLSSKPGKIRARKPDIFSLAKTAGATKIQFFLNRFYMLLSDNDIQYAFDGDAYKGVNLKYMLN